MRAKNDFLMHSVDAVSDRLMGRREIRRLVSRNATANDAPSVLVDDILISVDLPAPFSPTIAWTSPASNSRSTAFRAWVAPKRLSSFLRTRRGAPFPVAPLLLLLPPCCVWFIDGF